MPAHLHGAKAAATKAALITPFGTTTRLPSGPALTPQAPGGQEGAEAIVPPRQRGGLAAGCCPVRQGSLPGFMGAGEDLVVRRSFFNSVLASVHSLLVPL